jgi:hypothetical protein
MKLFITTYIKEQSLSLFVLITGISILFASVSYAYAPTDSLNKDSQKYLSFYETDDGESIHWEVNFDGTEITSIYKNGKRIPDELVNDYKDKIYDQLDEIRFGDRMFTFRMPVIPLEDFKIDMDEFRENMEMFKENLPEPEKYFEFHHFDNDEFKKEMEELQKNLKKLNPEDFKIPFDTEKFKEEMKELEKHLRKFHHDCDEEENLEI